jgi:Fur family transcriptional regulator, ferric uptake regulator
LRDQRKSESNPNQKKTRQPTEYVNQRATGGKFELHLNHISISQKCPTYGQLLPKLSILTHTLLQTHSLPPLPRTHPTSHLQYGTMPRDTLQRRAIRNAFLAQGRPLTPHEVLDASQPLAPSLGIATVYRNLKSLVDEGWLTTLELPGDNTRYERADIGHHHHFHCKACGRVFDIQGCPDQLANMVPPGFKLDDHELVLYGQCDACTP